MVLCLFFFFFFKQKTAYEMRISDWSSDVCSSDLWGPVPVPQGEELTFLTGLRSMTTAGDVALQTGMAAHLYLVNAPMRREYFTNADGELLVVPQQGDRKSTRLNSSH